MKTDEYKVYKVRWYIVLIYSLYASFQACVFNTWGPIAQSVKVGFDWSDDVVAWMSNVKIVAAAFTVPLTYPIVQWLGLRKTVVWSGVFTLAASTALRCVSLDSQVLKITSLVCGAVNGWTSIMIEGTITLLVVTWFPAGERTTATGIIVATQMAGLLPPSLMFPWLVSDPGKVLSLDAGSLLKSEIEKQVSYILYTEAGIGAAIFLAVLVYFPDSPPSPPSHSAQVERKRIVPALKMIFSNYKNVATGLAFSCITVPLMWITVVNQNLTPLGLDQVETGYISTSIIAVSFVFNILNSKMADIFYGNLKLVICTSLFISCGLSIWLALLCLEVISADKPSIFISAVGSMVFIRGIIGLFYELLMEIHFPVPESLVTLAWGQLGRIFAAIFLCMFSVLTGVSWMNYFLVSFTILPLILLLSVTMQYNRSNMDNKLLAVPPRYTSKTDEEFIFAYET